MQHATKYVSVDAIPNKRAISIEWPENIIGEFEKNIYIGTNEKNMKPLICIDILLSENQANGALNFIVRSDAFESHYTYKVIDGNVSIDNVSTPLCINIGRSTLSLSEFLCKDRYFPTVRFVDGTTLQGQYMAEYRNEDVLFDREKIQVWDWVGVNIKNESQGNEKGSTKLLQKSEMRKNMVMDLIYRGFIYAANYSESHYNPRRSQIKTELRYLFVTTPNR